MTDLSELIKQLEQLDTEQVNPDTVDIDHLTADEIVRKINEQDRTVAEVVATAQEPVARAAEIFAETLRAGSRVFYIGAGTSGRLGVLDAAECPPTFGTDPDQIVGVISGGYDTLVLSAEGVEDNEQAAVDDLCGRGLTKDDFVIGLAASSRTPYTLFGVRYAQSLGCRTALIVCNRADNIVIKPNVLIALPVGPEVITGSTRMKSGTAQKMALNMISTTAMVLLGKAYGNLMVDLKATSDKLAARSRKILMNLLGVTLDEADRLLERAGGSVKLALVMDSFGCTRTEAEQKLETAGGFLSKII